MNTKRAKFYLHDLISHFETKRSVAFTKNEA